MKSNLMPSAFRFLTLGAALALLAASQTAQAATVTWSGASTATMNWSDAANWTGGTPAGNSVVFPSLAFPASTNVQNTVNNIVDTSVSVTGLSYANTNGSGVLYYDTTLIQPLQTLTINGTLNVGVNNCTVNAALAGTNCTFIVSNTAGNLNIEGNSATAQTATLTLADATNIITVGTVSIGQTGGNNGRQATLNLGNSVNAINANTINLGTGKGSANIQFAGSSGSLTISNTAGNGRAAILCGNGTSGSGASKGSLLLAGHPAYVLASTLTLGELGDSSGNQSGVVTIDNGTFDVTTILMGQIPSSGSLSTGTATGSSLSVGSNAVTQATLVVNSPAGPGSGSFILSDNANSSHTSSGTLSIYTNGTAEVYCNITKVQAANNTATINLDGGTLVMESTNTIGSATIPIDNLNLTSGTLTVAVRNQAPVVVGTLQILDSNSKINVSSIPTLVTYPTLLPVITYSSLNNGGTISLGTLPGSYLGYISNDNSSTVWLVITNGPATAKTDEWGGAVNNNWDTSTLNWTNAGVAVAYAENDAVTFDDFAQTTNVNLVSAHTPLSVVTSNSIVNYTFEGPGSISGGASLTTYGFGSVTLAATGGDNFSGGITVNSGTVVLDEPNSAISGGLTIANGANAQIGNSDANGNLPTGLITDNGTLAFDGTGSLTVSNGITGSGSLFQYGSGSLTLAAANTYTGNTIVSNGTLVVTAMGAITNSSLLFIANGTLALTNLTASLNYNYSADLIDATLDVNAPYGQSPLTVNSGITTGGANTINVASLPPIAAYPTTITLLKSPSGFGGSGYNFVLGSLPAATPAYAGTIAESSDSTSVLLTLTSGPTGARPYVAWSGVDSLANVSSNWSDAMNWQTPGAPAPTEPVIFSATDGQGNPGLGTLGSGPAAANPANFNNLVDTSFTLTTLTYTNVGSGTYQNTWLEDGVTLTITNTGGLTIGSTTVDFGSASADVTIAGTNGTLNLPNTNSTIYVGVGSASSSGEQGVLDMSALGTFDASVSTFLIGVGSTSAGIAEGRESGVVYLAATNVIRATLPLNQTETSDTVNGTALDIGDDDGNAGAPNYLYLGQTNAIFADAIGVARQKASATVAFNPVFTQPSVYFRGQNGISAISNWDIGDGIGNSGTTSCNGTNDFTGGSVNALVTTMYLGRAADNGSGSGTSVGVLTFDNGTFDVSTLYAGYQLTNASKNGQGTINVNTNTVLGTQGTLVVGTLNLGINLNGASTYGTLNINGVVEANDIVAGTGSGLSTINLTNGTLEITGTAGSPAAPLTLLNLNGGLLELTANGAGTTNVVATSVATNGITTLQINSLVGAVTGTNYPLISYTGNDPFGSLSFAPLPAGYAGTLVDDTADNLVSLTLTAVPNALPPFVTGISLQAGNSLVFSGTNGTPGLSYYLLGTTNLALPLADWKVLSTNAFSSGNFSLTNAINPGTPQQFYQLEVLP